MGWAVGTSRQWPYRHIGYGVPATCDYPSCEAMIDRGISYTCGGMTDYGCGLHFCPLHLGYVAYDREGEIFDEGELESTELRQMEERGAIEYAEVCTRCATNSASFAPKRDTLEWALHTLRDSSWAQWRSEEPVWVRRMQDIVVADRGSLDLSGPVECPDCGGIGFEMQYGGPGDCSRCSGSGSVEYVAKAD